MAYRSGRLSIARDRFEVLGVRGDINKSTTFGTEYKCNPLEATVGAALRYQTLRSVAATEIGAGPGTVNVAKMVRGSSLWSPSTPLSQPSSSNTQKRQTQAGYAAVSCARLRKVGPPRSLPRYQSTIHNVAYKLMERTNRSRNHLENVLYLQEICHLNDRKVSLKEDNFKYLIGQMDLRSIVGDFTAAILLEKPTRIFSFASEHFAALRTSTTPSPPMLNEGVPALVVTGARQLQVLDALNQQFPGKFLSPVMTTTRPPHRSERPGITMNFVTLEMINADIRGGKYLESGASAEVGCKGELIGTTLEAVARIRATGAVPLLHVSYERAVSARMCGNIKPTPYAILVCSENEPPQQEHRSSFDKLIYARSLDQVIAELVAVIKAKFPTVVRAS